jgi:hypothetical protein
MQFRHLHATEKCVRFEIRHIIREGAGKNESEDLPLPIVSTMHREKCSVMNGFIRFVLNDV